jgi:hypothetical protein
MLWAQLAKDSKNIIPIEPLIPDLKALAIDFWIKDGRSVYPGYITNMYVVDFNSKISWYYLLLTFVSDNRLTSMQIFDPIKLSIP